MPNPRSKVTTVKQPYINQFTSMHLDENILSLQIKPTYSYVHHLVITRRSDGLDQYLTIINDEIIDVDNNDYDDTNNINEKKHKTIRLIEKVNKAWGTANKTSKKRNGKQVMLLGG